MTDWHLAAVLMGDVVREASARTKYGHFFDALQAEFPLLSIHDTSLQGIDRWLNLAQAFHPNRQRWRERSYKNKFAFQQRSHNARDFVQSQQPPVNLVLQVGVLFQTCTALPTIIYSDYTSQLSARKISAGRSPFSPRQREAWIDMEREALRQATHVFTRGEFVREAMIDDYGLQPERVTAVGGGVNFTSLPEVIPASDGPPTALFIGKELYRKGGDLLLRAFALVRKQLPTARLLLLTGDAPPSELSLAGVEVIAPTWDRTVIANLYRQAHCFVLPSRLETWGDVFLEAMAYGLPCLGVNDEAMPEIIDHEENGLIVPPEDVDALAQALVQLLSDSELQRQWGAAARHKVESHYTWAQVVTKMTPIIHQVIQNNRN